MHTYQYTRSQILSQRCTTDANFDHHRFVFSVIPMPVGLPVRKQVESGWMASLQWHCCVIDRLWACPIKMWIVGKVKLEKSDVTQGKSESGGGRLRLLTCQRWRQKSPESALRPPPPKTHLFPFLFWSPVYAYSICIFFCLDYGENISIFCNCSLMCHNSCFLALLIFCGYCC